MEDEMFLNAILLPMIFSTGVESNGSRSLAVGTIGGMLVGTVSLLLFVPLLFIMFRYVEERVLKR